MACRYTYQGKTYEAHEFDDVLRAMRPDVAVAYMPGVKSIHTAPFVGKTDGWLTLALKRVMVLATEGGYDKVAFVNGEQSADRYDLSKQISKVLWNEDTARLTAWDKNTSGRRTDGRTVVDESGVTADRLEEFVGKDVAKKLIDQATDEDGDRTLSGLDLKVGGEGMKKFYDAIVPNATKALLKKIGGGAMDDVRLGVAAEYRLHADNGQTIVFKDEDDANEWLNDNSETGWGEPVFTTLSKQPGFTITPAMREVVAAGVPLFSPARAPMFTSPLSTAIEGVPDRLATMAAPQWKLWLDANAAKLGVKKDEIEWSGVKDYLALRGKDKVTRDEIAGYLKANGVQLGESVLGFDSFEEMDKLNAALEPTGYHIELDGDDSFFFFNPSGDEVKVHQLPSEVMGILNMEERGRPNTKYGNYTLDGGTNYREVLVTLPERGGLKYTEDNVTTLPADDQVASRPDLFWYFKAPDNVFQISKKEHPTEAEAKAYILQRKQPAAPASNNFKSGHWDPKNILVHLRVDDRQDADGKKVLFINEVQSDWGQEGKKKGFRSGDKPAEQAYRDHAADLKKRYEAMLFEDLGSETKDPERLARQVKVFMTKVDTGGMALAMGEKPALNKLERAWNEEIRVNAAKISPAPFVTDTKAWVGLGLKRAIIMAVDGGYDRVALITGQQAADLYQLSKQVSEVTAKKLDSGKVMLSVDGKDGDPIFTGDLATEELEEYVGKELAIKITNDTQFQSGMPNKTMTYSGLDLNVGGEGMKAFYDQIVPQVTRDLLKKLGGGTMGTAGINTEMRMGEYDIYQRPAGDFALRSRINPTDAWSPNGVHATREAAEAYMDELKAIPRRESQQPAFDITDAMRDKVVAGVPLFSPARAAPETAAFKAWFKDSKVVDAQGKPLVVYHGTSAKNAEFTVFRYKTQFFTSDFQTAMSYDNRSDALEDTIDRVKRVYLSIQNPLEMDLDGRFWDSVDQEAVFKDAKKRGHDGVIFRNVNDPGGGGAGVPETTDTFITFTKTQIKSATDNNGDFDGANPDIRRSAFRDAINKRTETIVGKTNRTHTPDQLAAMKRVGFQVESPSIKERFEALTKNLGKRMAQGIVDQFAPIKELSQHAYLLTRLSKGASGAFESFLRGGKLKLSDGVYDFDDQDKGGVVDKLLIPLQGEHHDFFRWVAANRAERLLGEDKEHLFTQDDIDALKTLADGGTAFSYTIQNGPNAGTVTRNRKDIYADSLITFNAFNTNIMDLAEQSGLIDGDARHLWEQEFYVPFYRVADEIDGGVRGMGAKGSMVRQQAFKKLKGGKNALNADLLDNTLMNWAHLLDASAKNRAAKATLEAAVNLGVAIEANEATVKQMGKDAKSAPVWFMDSGKQRHFVVEDPMLLTAISSLEYAGMRNPVMNAMGMMKHVLTVGVTASPFFKIRNLIRDSVSVIGTGQINYNPAGNIAQGWGLTDPKSDAYFKLLAGGGTIHFGTMLEGSEAKRVQSLVNAGVDDATILDSEGKVKAFYRHYVAPAVDAYNELGNRSEAMNRAALYDQLVKKGMSHAEASLQARDLMDFSMQGSFTSVRFLTQVVPFLNARLQGMYKLGRAANEDPKRMAMVLGAVSLASLALLAAYGDDDDWKKREDWDRNNFWWFKMGGKAFRIPKPFEIGAIGTLAERGFEFMFDKEMTGKRLRSQVLTLLSDNLAMNPVPQLIKPIIDIYANKDAFSGRPIESMGMEKLAPEYRFTGRTSMVARATSTALNTVTGTVGVDSLSPVQIDSMLRGYFGWLGSFAVGSADFLARPTVDEPVRASTDLWKMLTGSIVSDLRDAPSRYVSQMYDQSKVLSEAYGTHRMLLKAGKAGEAEEFKQDHLEELSRYRSVEAVKQATTKYNARAREIERSDMSAEEKRAALRELNRLKDVSARRVLPE